MLNEVLDRTVVVSIQEKYSALFSFLTVLPAVAKEVGRFGTGTRLRSY